MKNKIFDSIPDLLEESTAPWSDVVEEDYHVKVFADKYPVSKGHLLFVPKYNSVNVLVEAFEDAIRWGQDLIEQGECDGFNIGLNYGPSSGQTIDWPHIHLIPRRKGDVENIEDVIGGVRNVIPGKGNYKK